MNRYSIDESWEFWKTIICDKDGNIDVEQLKKELCDFYFVINEVPKVYCEVTGGTLSKILYDPETVISCFNERYGQKAVAVDYLVDDWDLVTAECETNEEYKKAIFEYLEVEEE